MSMPPRGLQSIVFRTCNLLANTCNPPYLHLIRLDQTLNLGTGSLVKRIDHPNRSHQQTSSKLRDP